MSEAFLFLSVSPAAEMDWPVWAALAMLSAGAGLIKGITGFGFPMIMFSGMSLFFDPAFTVACLTLPLLAVNILQALQFGVRAAFREARSSFVLTAALCVCIFAAAPLVTLMQPSHLFAVLGPTITIVALIQLAGWRFRLPERLRRPGAAVSGIAAGLSGGFAGVWAPLIVLYLLALDIEKNRQILIQGVVYTVGSFALIAAHARTGIVNSSTLPVSLVLVAPSLLGLLAGTLVLGKLNRKTFTVCTLVVLVAAGLNLIWRAAAG